MISLIVTNGIAFVWNPEDWFILRTEHRICGSLIGALPSYPRQNGFLGLPMALLSEEAALLVEKGVCELFEIPQINETPSEDEKQAIKSAEDIVLSEQIEALKKRKLEEFSKRIDIIVAGKEKKLMSKGATDVMLDKEVILQEEMKKPHALSPSKVLIHLPMEHLNQTEKKRVNIDVLKPGVLEGNNAIKYHIYKELWEQGNYITNGSKFGSDYLIYPGDPSRFHATYMVKCVCDQNEPFYPTSLVAFGRLSVAVNKLAVLAFCNAYGKIEYQTLQWHDSTI